MDFRHLLSGLLGAALGSVLTHAAHLQAKTAAQADKILDVPAGTTQSLLNTTEQAIVKDAANDAVNEAARIIGGK